MSPFLTLYLWQGVMKRIALDPWGTKPATEQPNNRITEQPKSLTTEQPKTEK